MKSFFRIFFMVLGVIFFILILVGAYLIVADPFEIRPLIKSITTQSAPTKNSTNEGVVDKNPLLSSDQEQALEKIGINPAALPANITPSMEKCFYSKLGSKRADEIKNGSEPTAADYFAARSCF